MLESDESRHRQDRWLPQWVSAKNLPHLLSQQSVKGEAVPQK